MDVAVLERQLLLNIYNRAADLVKDSPRDDGSNTDKSFLRLRENVTAYRDFVTLKKAAERDARASQYANVAGEL